MKIDAIVAGDLADAASVAAEAERLGFDGIMVPEVAHDPFLPLTLASPATSRIRLQTGIAVAFARNPMTVAVTASDLQRLSAGRFVLGLGTQIKPHITRRYSMPWSDPAARMREFVEAVRAIWRAWHDQTALEFRGGFYQHTLMTPMFDHGPSPYGPPPVHVAAVGPRMTTLAGEVADGYLSHGFTTAAYLRDVTLPHLQDGLGRAGRTRGDIEVSLPAMTVLTTGDGAPLDAMRATIAFYGSTPAYRPVLAHHGWAELGEDLHALSKRGDWTQMASLIDDDVLHTFAVVGTAKEVAAAVHERYGAIVDRIQLAFGGEDTPVPDLLDAIRATP